MTISAYHRGVEILGDMGTGGAPSVGTVYSDAGTVKRVQKALGISVDGQIGPETRSAVKKFNEQRGAPGDGENITDGTLAAIAGFEYSRYMAAQAKPKAPAPAAEPKASGDGSPTPAMPGRDEPGFFSTNVPGIDRPLWQVLIGALGIGSIAVGLFSAFRSGKK